MVKIDTRYNMWVIGVLFIIWGVAELWYGNYRGAFLAGGFGVILMLLGRRWRGIVYEKRYESLPPDVNIMKDSEPYLVLYQKSLTNMLTGGFVLTDKHLVFVPGKFESGEEAYLIEHEHRLDIPLEEIIGVEKGLGATLKVHADKEYVFKGMLGVEDWETSIENAR